MASSTDEINKSDSGICVEMPAVPVRHKKILDKLARCSYCSRLCCCIEHCLMHESKHSESERVRKGHCIAKTHEWIEASESALSSRVVKNEFPFFCVYCKIKVQDENDLRHLMISGSLCPIKKCHWMVPLTIIHENSEEIENKENILGMTEGRSVFNTSHFTPKKPPEKSLLRRALTNCLNLSHRTPPQANYQETTSVVGPLTSTPESDYVSCTSLATDVSPTTPTFPCASNLDQHSKERVGILSHSPRNKTRPKGIPTRRVTFACDPEILKYANESSENENENAGSNRKECGKNEEMMKAENGTVKEDNTDENVPLQTLNRHRGPERLDKY